MKKTVLTFSLILVSIIAFSQAKFEIGLKAGANFANTDISGISTDAITSFHGGAYALIKLAAIGIQPEVLISTQGAEFPGGGDLDFSYLNIPVMIKYYLPLGLNIQAGPQFGILTNAEDEEGTDISDTLKGSDLGLAFGAGWDAPFGLQVSARYILGLSDVNDDPISDAEIKNNVFQIAVGYSLFKLGK